MSPWSMIWPNGANAAASSGSAFTMYVLAMRLVSHRALLRRPGPELGLTPTHRTLRMTR